MDKEELRRAYLEAVLLYGDDLAMEALKVFNQLGEEITSDKVHGYVISEIINFLKKTRGEK